MSGQPLIYLAYLGDAAKVVWVEQGTAVSTSVREEVAV